ncbi:MAG: PRC-barrel domain-containing protein [Acidobacteriales bacterium]|nr:PRC-barrel domain-containing protein [Terriglobales bacterium]
MPHLGTLRDYRFATDAQDIRGSNVYGPGDQELGTIDDVIFNHTSSEIRYLVVDTGGWLSSRKFLVPADALEPSEKHENDFSARLTKEQIERFPAYDDKLLERSEDWEEYERKYEKSWEEGPVMHIKGSERVLIPPDVEPKPAKSAPSPSGSVRQMPNLEKEGGVVGRYEPRTPSTMPPLARETHDIGTSELRSPAGTPVSEASARTTAAVRRRWQEFENSLRNNREELLSRCSVCSPGSERKREVA